MYTKDNLYDLVNGFHAISTKICSVDIKGFQGAFNDADATIFSSIVYIFRSEKPIPRLKGESDILYIGQTKGTIQQRYLGYCSHLTSTKANCLKYSHVIENFGPIRIAVAPYQRFGKTLREAEGQLLWWYFQNHCEYPPFNYSKTNIRNDILEPSMS